MPSRLAGALPRGVLEPPLPGPRLSPIVRAGTVAESRGQFFRARIRSAGAFDRHRRMTFSRSAGMLGRTMLGRVTAWCRMRVAQFLDPASAERGPADQQEIPDRAQSVNIAPGVDRVVVAELFRGHEVRTAAKAVFVGDEFRIAFPHQSEVQHFHEVKTPPSSAANKLLGLTSRCTRPAACASPNDPQARAANQQRAPAASARDRARVRRGHAAQQLHDVIPGAVAGPPKIIDLDRVRVRQLGRGSHLGLEAGNGLLVDLPIPDE